jgi:hypothetical protein
LTFTFDPSGLMTVTSAPATGLPPARSLNRTLPPAASGTSSVGTLSPTSAFSAGTAPTSAFGW